MFDIGWSELVVIAVVALIAIGPKELPATLRSLGHWMGKIRSMAAEFQNQFREAMREAEMADLKKTADDLNEAARSVTSTLTSAYDPTGFLKGADDGPKPAASTEQPAASPAQPIAAASSSTDTAGDTAESPAAVVASSEPASAPGDLAVDVAGGPEAAPAPKGGA